MILDKNEGNQDNCDKCGPVRVGVIQLEQREEVLDDNGFKHI